MFNEDSVKYSGSEEPSQNNNSINYSSGKKGFVISVGGSVFFGEKPFVEKIIGFCDMINDLSNEFSFVLVVGGGKPAREYIQAGKELRANNFDLDSIGIIITRANAKIISLRINNSIGVLSNVDNVKNFVEQGRIPICGGLIEGMTTDGVASLIAEKLGFDFINLSNVDGIYDSDPKENDDAFFFKELSFNDMNFLLKDFVSKPGQNMFVDLLAANILSRSKIKSFFLNGNYLENFKNCLRGNDFKGTIVHETQDFIERDVALIERDPRKKIVRKTKKYDASKLTKKMFVRKDFDDVIDPKQIDFG